MLQFIFKRLLHMIPLLLGVSLLTFLLMAMSPGNYFTALQQNPQISPDTIARLKAQFHLDHPWYVQYFFWLKNVLSGNFGYSMAYKISATSLIVARLWNTFLLSFFALHHCVGHRHSFWHLGGGQKRFVGGPRLLAVRLCRVCPFPTCCCRCWRCGSRPSPAGFPSAARKVRSMISCRRRSNSGTARII